MGNIFSSEEKLLRHQRNEIIIERNPRKIVGVYEHYGYHQTNISLEEHRYKKRRNVSFNGKYGRNYYFKTKSQSLNAILEELYSFGPETNSGAGKINFESGRSLIPRIKLKRSTSSLKEEKKYKALCKMSSQSDIFIESDLTNSSPDITFKNNELNANEPESNIMILLNDQRYDKISKSDENYFTKNFDDCMKCLELIEKEHELIEKEDGEVQFCSLQKENTQTDLPEINKSSSDEKLYDFKSDCDVKKFENWSAKEENYENDTNSENQPHPEKTESIDSCGKSAENANITNENEAFTKETKEPVPTTWYSNLKEQFEKKEQENKELKTKEMSCRITGATLKKQNEKAKSESPKTDTRHYFHRLVKTNKSLIDEELPDPDKVKHIRAMFQETLDSTLKRKLDKKLGGSLQNISIRIAEQQMNRPLSAQCYRNDLYCDQKSNEEKNKKTSSPDNSKSLRDINGEFHIENTKKKLFEKYEKDLKPSKELKGRRILQPKWTDTGSVSSGISSDLSSYDTDLESISREGTEQDEVTVSDDDLLEEMKEKHYVQNEILEKIRSFGTSVTYYGGEMITCSIGPLLSPTTKAIMEEINEKYGDETNPARSFDEFYRKYVETNENNRKKKIGRTRSFGQNDVFQKPNVLNNAEIEMYKNDLEIEIGIKKPVGIPQNTLKRKVIKSASLDSKTEIKLETEDSKRISELPVVTAEPVNDRTPVQNDSDTMKESSEEHLCNEESSTIIEKVTEEIPIDNTSHSETKFQNETESYMNTLENEDTKSDNTQEKEPKKISEEPMNLTSKSVLKNSTDNYEIVSNGSEHPAKDIFFSYEKSIFNGKRKSDMEFEEFEVCESLSEKLEKLEKINGVGKATDSLETLPQEEVPKTFEEKSDEVLSEPTSEPLETKNDFKDMHTNDWKTSLLEKIENNQNEIKKDFKYNYPRWPIETSVMVDIQKNNEQTPKIITSGKTLAKTKMRLF